MIHYYTNREISEKLGINPARWKRWSRAFLPPDPLGGMQSGYARQYLYGDLFTVFLGGHLLSHHKLTVPESVRMISDLASWMKKAGFLDLKKNAGVKDGICLRVLFYRENGAKTGSPFRYLIQEIRRPVVESHGSSVHSPAAVISETVLGKIPENPVRFYENPETFLLNLSALSDFLVTGLGAR
ncbi:hypothetical protein LJC71_08130 [Desulfosarcina sp. OttesenSCG-928-A07]|nr:hypothetical protein [Desulfosarcina sp. OttesenSCG-928-G17]MDL2329694.1 hypothetical protein [Desulfosarcina sp. OttesenSCG-928-A07]